MATNALSFMYNASGHTLTFGSGGKTLSTGVSSFRFHFSPISPSLARTPFGARSQYQAVCNRRLSIRPGDFLVLSKWGGSGVSPVRRFRIEGLAEYPHSTLDHVNLALSEHLQSG